MSFEIRHDADRQRFHTTVEGALCVLDYSLAGGVMTIAYTGVPTEVGGRGIAAALVRASLDTAREHGWKVVPACSYAAAWMGRHVEYEDLRA
ncbi:GNAT family N-acetyltransferase [Frateuria defendens]|uniref:GNAT family N-acetyltransferase n=1 Tax=Frateuria defendens TaxID=2219559 RepID=UPI00066FFB73|nr:GNAT family N-acetyltransferase [Frateuria defendens]